MKDPKGVLKKIVEYFFSAAIIGLALLLLLWFLYYFNVFPMPKFVTELFDGQDGGVDSSYYNEDDFYDFLEKKESVDTELLEVELTVDNVKKVIAAIDPVDTFYWKAETEIFYEDKSDSSTHNVWSQNGKVRVDSVTTFENVTTVIENDTTGIRNNFNGQVNKIVGDTDFSFDEMINIADIDFYMDSSLSEVKEAKFIKTDDGEYLFVSFYTGELDKTDSFYLSLDCGIVLFAYSEIASETVFNQKTLEFRKQETLGEDVFKIG